MGALVCLFLFAEVHLWIAHFSQKSILTLCLLVLTSVIFAHSLDSDPVWRFSWQNVGPDLDPNCLTLLWYSWKIFLKKKSADNKQVWKNA